MLTLQSIKKNSWCINYNQYIQNKTKKKLCMKAIDNACFKLQENATRGVKNNKRNFINVIGDEFTTSIK